MIILEGFERNW